MKYLLILYVFFGPPGEKPLAGIEIDTKILYSTEQECQKAALAMSIASTLPLSGADLKCEKVKTS